jgi:hypothetical protein
MTGTEIRAQFAGEIPASCRFVRWWRRENDFVDYDLAERFRANLTDSVEIGGVECVSHEQLWQELQRLCGERITLQHSNRFGTVISWARRDASGLTVTDLPYTDQALIDIFDEETGGNPID